MVRVLAIWIAAIGAWAQTPANQETAKAEASLFGRVMQASSGAGIGAARVTVYLGGDKKLTTTADASGGYSVKGIPPGSYRVAAQSADGEGRVRWGANATRRVTLRAGEELVAFDFRLVIHGRVTGKVVDQNNEPVPGLRVVAVAREYHAGALRAVLTSGTMTDDLGEYVIERLEPGRAYLIMADRGAPTLSAYSEAPLDPALRRQAVAPTFFPNSKTLEGGEPVVLRDGETREGVNLKVARTPSFCVEGRISGDLGPKASFTIAPVQPASGSVGNGASYYGLPRGTVPADGKVRICDLSPGDYEVTVNEFGGGAFGDLVNFSASTLTISDRDLANFSVVARPRVPLAGEVTWFGQAPDPPLTAKIRLDLQAVTRTNRANTTASLPGEFTFTGSVPMDEYQLDIASVPSGVYVKDVIYGDRSVLLTTIRPGAGMGDAPLRIVLANDGGTIAARVADKDGNPVPECNVIVLPETAPSEALVAAAMRTGKTGQDGLWSSATMAPGKYIVIATLENVNRSPETVGRLWKARGRGETVEVAAGGKVSVTLAVKGLD